MKRYAIPFALMGSALVAACGGTTSAGTAPDSSTDNNLGACSSLTADGSPVVEQFKSDPPPAPLGGTVRDGTYDLIAFTYWGSSNAGAIGREWKMTMRLASGVYEGVGSRGTNAMNELGTVTISGTTFDVQTTCPRNHTTQASYTVTGDEVHVYGADDSRELTFKRRP